MPGRQRRPIVHKHQNHCPQRFSWGWRKSTTKGQQDTPNCSQETQAHKRTSTIIPFFHPAVMQGRGQRNLPSWVSVLLKFPHNTTCIQLQAYRQVLDMRGWQKNSVNAISRRLTLVVQSPARQAQEQFTRRHVTAYVLGLRTGGRGCRCEEVGEAGSAGSYAQVRASNNTWPHGHRADSCPLLSLALMGCAVGKIVTLQGQ